ncbi:NmrA family NAD(P)-binding protein [Amycolatopsis taiwanensis]|uniref:NmrA family NAD(P)-binding protein n=1 Tax=Amycolatopsis taiwanensis TaxID=342230 RepID=UPI000488681F|nr:NmrA family NAD(P)-binding protein [Amycolatopsis taiwanensis]
MDRLVLVAGATGQQGGAVAARLLADGWRIRILTRDATGEKARALAAAGAEVIEGTLADKDTIDRSVRGTYGVFSVHPGPLSPGQDEASAGKEIADAVREHGVTHLVYSSAIGADGMQPQKWEVEQHIHRLGISATILRPSSFMENYHSQSDTVGVSHGALRTAAAPHVKQQFIALDDIAAFTALALADPQTYRGKTLDLVGDVLTPPQAAAAISKATGRNVPYLQRPIEELRAINERFARGYEIINAGVELPGFDIEELRRLHPGLMTFETWLARKGATMLKELLD